MTLKLRSDLCSRQDIQAVALEIRRFEHWYRQAVIKQRVAGSSLPGQPGLSPAAADLLNQWHVDKQLSSQSLDALVKELEVFLASAPYVTITLAGPAPGKLKAEIVNWFRQNVRQDLLIDFSFNATMLGGMVVRYGSRIADWSFRRQILANRYKFPETLRNV